MRASGHGAGRLRARTQGLVVKTVGEDVLVYDLGQHRAHALNPQAAALWRQCDGRRTRDELREAAAAAGTTLDADAVDFGLAELARAGLLAEAPGSERGLTRRQALRRAGLAAAVGLPLVTSIVAPSPAAAQSPPCVGGDLPGPCPGSPALCCAGFCCGQVCGIPGLACP